MTFSIVIPTCNRLDLLTQCIELLMPEQQQMSAGDYEIIVTDDSAEDAVKRSIRHEHPLIKWVKGPGKGPAANRNNGAKYSTGKWLVFLDDDCLPQPGLLQVYKKATETDKGTMVFEGCIKADREQKSLVEESPVNEKGGRLWSCNFMISKELFIKLNGFDEKFPYAAMEDVELHYRLNQLNIDCKFLKDAQVVHPWRLQKKLISLTLRRFKSTLYFLKKHPEARNKINSKYYLKAFYFYFFKQTLKKCISYNFRGFLPKVLHDMLHLYLALYLLLAKKVKCDTSTISVS